ncbi:MAG: sigma-54-dependent Fis family transcriptional regulator [Candidatus Marinimicrobia bacterium]|nr:sigma-54-dependent Fis family transcriptional regulator [Candidatus Neomarinimicrobiota bacterium]
MSVAVRKNLSYHEIIRLKEATEADKRKLLTKLGREKVSEEIIGTHTGLQSVTERVNMVAKSDLPVLIFGETGTGKELVARSIHNQSGRSKGPFIRVNCGAIPPELIDSQLFGHEKGAFTGAVETRIGWFERANDGTLFLDEIGDLPLEAQVRFLRILQDGWMERVGGKYPIRVNVRIVLATNRDLVTLVARGNFREDLWYRISTFPIFLPPLRERKMDMKLLAAHFIKQSATRFGLSEVLLTDQDIQLLTDYRWPGNIRELKAVIDRAVLLGNGNSLEISRALGWQNTFGEKTSAIQPIDKTLRPLDEAIKTHIEQALKRTKGKVEGQSGAARLLKINPQTLRSKMRKLGINWNQFKEN